MAVNRDKPDRWKNDIAQSVDFYNEWFISFAPEAFRSSRIDTTEQVARALERTQNLTNIQPIVLCESPEVLPILRMATCPPIARDRLIGLADVPPNLVKTMETKKRIPSRMPPAKLQEELSKITALIEKLVDPDIFVWFGRDDSGSEEEVHRAATVVADRLCGAISDPIIRNAQERRQLASIQSWLEDRGYRALLYGEVKKFADMPSGTFSFRFNVPIQQESGNSVKIPIDAVVMPKEAASGSYPVFFEAKSAGDYTNVNKRRKEEAAKMAQLKRTYGDRIRFNLFLCGYFNSGYLGYEAAEGIDWVWEHRIDDLSEFGL